MRVIKGFLLAAVCLTFGMVHAQDFKVLWAELEGCVVHPDSGLTKVVSGGFGVAGAYATNSSPRDGDVSFSLVFSPDHLGMAFGLSSGFDGTQLTDIDYSFYIDSLGNLFITESGKFMGAFGRLRGGEVLEIHAVSSTDLVSFVKDGAALISLVKQSDDPLSLHLALAGDISNLDSFSSSVPPNPDKTYFLQAIDYEEDDKSFEKTDSLASWSNSFAISEALVPFSADADLSFFTPGSEGLQGQPEYFCIGLIDGADSNSVTPASVLHGFMFRSGMAYILESGRLIGSLGKYAGNAYSISIMDGQLEYAKNGVKYHSVAAPLIDTRVGVSIFELSKDPSVTNVEFFVDRSDLLATTFLIDSSVDSLDMSQSVIVEEVNEAIYEWVLWNDQGYLKETTRSNSLPLGVLAQLGVGSYSIIVRTVGRTGDYGPWTEALVKHVKRPPNPQLCQEDEDRRHDINKVYDLNGLLVGQSVVYYDSRDRVSQSQVWNFDEQTPLVTQYLYDRNGRSVGRSLTAPSYSDEFCYVESFMTVNGVAYDHDAFDDPIGAFDQVNGVVGALGLDNTQQGSLGWYYSDNNTREPFVPASQYPFSLLEYSELNLNGPVRLVAAPGDHHFLGSENETKVYTMASDGDIAVMTGYSGNRGLYKQIAVDSQGKTAVSYVNEFGKIAATAVSGQPMECGYIETQAVLSAYGARSADIHVPEVAIPDLMIHYQNTPTTLDYFSEYEFQIVDLATERLLVEGVDYQFEEVIQGSTVRAAVNGRGWVRNFSVPLTMLGNYAQDEHFYRISFTYDIDEFENFEELLVYGQRYWFGDDGNQESRDWRGAGDYYGGLSDVRVSYGLDYSNWTYYEYDNKGDIEFSVQPEGIVCPVLLPFVPDPVVIEGESVGTTGGFNSTYVSISHYATAQSPSVLMIGEEVDYFDGLDYDGMQSGNEDTRVTVDFRIGMAPNHEVMSGNITDYPLYPHYNTDGDLVALSPADDSYIASYDDGWCNYGSGGTSPKTHTDVQSDPSRRADSEVEHFISSNFHPYEEFSAYSSQELLKREGSWAGNQDAGFLMRDQQYDPEQFNQDYCYQNSGSCTDNIWNCGELVVDQSSRCPNNEPFYQCIFDGFDPVYMGKYIYTFDFLVDYTEIGEENSGPLSGVETVATITMELELNKSCNCDFVFGGWEPNAYYEVTSQSQATWTPAFNRVYGEDISIVLSSCQADFENEGPVDYDEQAFMHSFANKVEFEFDYVYKRVMQPWYEPPTNLHDEEYKESYEYDAVGNLMSTDTPDEGLTEMLYDDKHRLRFSQDAQQKIDAEFSYVQYGPAHRLIEQGVYDEYMGHLYFQTADSELINGSIRPYVDDNEYPPIVGKKARTSYLYDFPATDFPHSEVYGRRQEFVSGRLSRTYNTDETGQRVVTSWYSYDYLGRVTSTVRRIHDTGELKIIDVKYNALSAISQVDYQRDLPGESFSHKYSYDLNGRLSKVSTSADGATYEEQAQYEYYDHGPLKRSEIGDDLQGLDYIYTLQGWLKSINNPSTIGSDPGGDGGLNSLVDADLFAMSIDYFDGDYRRAGSQVQHGTSLPGQEDDYSGAIASISWRHRADDGQDTDTEVFAYDYDLFGRLIESKYGLVTTHGDLNSPGGGGASAVVDYSDLYHLSDVEYDKNGNILGLKRNGNITANLTMDDLRPGTSGGYHYLPGSNKLDHVKDATPEAHYPDDIDGQLPNNYLYDAKGRMVADEQASRYYVYGSTGLLAAVFRDAAHTSPVLDIIYDEAGARLRKRSYSAFGDLQKVTWYFGTHIKEVDYAFDPNTSAYEPETSTDMYTVGGAARVGAYYRQLDEYRYEISDHLGNVRSAFRKAADGRAEVLSRSDYYPFGMRLPGGNALTSSPAPLHSYQGQLHDEETGQIAFALRQYDPRLGRWMNPDPYRQHWSPYLAMSNNPISFIDPDGGTDYMVDGVIVSEFMFNSIAGNSQILSADYAGMDFNAYGEFDTYTSIHSSKVKTRIEIEPGVIWKGKATQMWETTFKVPKVFGDAGQGHDKEVIYNEDGTIRETKYDNMLHNALFGTVNFVPNTVGGVSEISGDAFAEWLNCPGKHRDLDAEEEFIQNLLMSWELTDEGLWDPSLTDEEARMSFINLSMELVLPNFLKMGVVASGENAARTSTIPLKSTVGAARAGFSKLPKGFKETKQFGYQHGQKVYKYKGKFYSRDIDAHNGGAWKVFENVGGSLKRLGTADEFLNIFKQ